MLMLQFVSKVNFNASYKDIPDEQFDDSNKIYRIFKTKP
jgi:hypothetical protein